MEYCVIVDVGEDEICRDELKPSTEWTIEQGQETSVNVTSRSIVRLTGTTQPQGVAKPDSPAKVRSAPILCMSLNAAAITKTVCVTTTNRWHHWIFNWCCTYFWISPKTKTSIWFFQYQQLFTFPQIDPVAGGGGSTISTLVRHLVPLLLETKLRQRSIVEFFVGFVPFIYSKLISLDASIIHPKRFTRRILCWI